jgi:hypothetical protein
MTAVIVVEMEVMAFSVRRGEMDGERRTANSSGIGTRLLPAPFFRSREEYLPNSGDSVASCKYLE